MTSGRVSVRLRGGIERIVCEAGNSSIGDDDIGCEIEGGREEVTKEVWRQIGDREVKKF